jgi:hypothetical protein
LVAFNQRPVIRLEFEQSSGVRHHAWCMAAAERASAASDRIVFRPACQPKPHMNVAAVTSAKTVHAVQPRDSASARQRLPTTASQDASYRSVQWNDLVIECCSCGCAPRKHSAPRQ